MVALATHEGLEKGENVGAFTPFFFGLVNNYVICFKVKVKRFD
ncbi:hypothetical protein SAMN05421820_113117 [Pedobacter steynii]|uniref:Uncharacterized protein n=1 Tax=Pedobacter steynii TaxID=430522 RepID=A0A1H0ID63_9SPHI|nr:hypothetical protein SAMN05421820_113117 [Pedobacter steynii]